jgi:hypothetical protein
MDGGTALFRLSLVWHNAQQHWMTGLNAKL